MFELLVFLTVMSCGVAFGYKILQPYAQAVHGHARPTRFIMSDFFTLMFLLGFPSLFVSFSREWNRTDWVLVPGALLIGVFGFAWWRATATLSGLGVYQPFKRSVFQVVVLPIVLLGSLFGVPITLGTTFLLVEMELYVLMLWFFAVVGLIVSFAVCRFIGRWILEDTDFEVNRRKANRLFENRRSTL